MEIGYRDHRRVVELDAPLATVVIGQIVKGDANADRFVLEMKNGGQPADLTGYSADGLFINRLGMEVPLRATVSGSEIEMVLTGGCYDVGGAAVGHVRLVSSDASQIRTVIRFVADVTRDGSGVAYDPDGVIGDLDALLAKLTAMEAATADGIAAAKEARSAGAQAIADANAAGEVAKATAQAAADDATAAAETARSTIYTRAVAIPDESALAASHELYAQRDYPLNVAVHGYTVQEGEGDPSPDNVRPIHGLDAAQVRAGGKNLLNTFSFHKYEGDGSRYSVDQNGQLVFSNTTMDMIHPETEVQHFPAGTYTLSVTNPPKTNIFFQTSITEPYSIAVNQSLPVRTMTFDRPFTAFILTALSSGLSGTITLQLESGATATPYEPYLANTADLPLLPDNSPLMEGGTVENWVASGCDKKITFNGSESWSAYGAGSWLPNILSDLAAGYPVYSDRIRSGTGTDVYSGREAVANELNAILLKVEGAENSTALRTYLAANPLTVYYRSTEYTPDKDLKVCRVVRRKKLITADGEHIAFAMYENSVTYALIKIPGIKADSYTSSDTLCSAFTSDTKTGTWSGSAGIAVEKMAFPGSVTDLTSANEWLREMNKAGMPVEFVYNLATPEIYMTDPLPLLPPAALESDTVTVTGSGETEVEYAHETKHYIDSQIAAAVALALNG